jgi:hypothetical protein
MATQGALVFSVVLDDSLPGGQGLVGRVLSLLRRQPVRRAGWTVVCRGAGSGIPWSGPCPDAVLKIASTFARIGIYQFSRRDRAWLVIMPRTRMAAAELRARIRCAVPRIEAGEGVTVDAVSDLNPREVADLLRGLSVDAPDSGGARETQGSSGDGRPRRSPLRVSAAARSQPGPRPPDSKPAAEVCAQVPAVCGVRAGVAVPALSPGAAALRPSRDGAPGTRWRRASGRSPG